ncbi:hypothetical protein CAOG_08795, partial [Capsaspora owczarzaki ATCC 30864]
AIERLPQLRESLLNQLLDSFHMIRTPVVSGAALWIAGEYAHSLKQVQQAMSEIQRAIGELPIVESEARAAAALAAGEFEAAAPSSAEAPSLSAPMPAKRLVAADGTYITQSALSQARPSASAGPVGSRSDKPALRAMYLDGDYSTAPILASTLVKLALRARELAAAEPNGVPVSNAFSAQCMLILASILHLGRSGLATAEIDDDVHERLMVCVRVLADPDDPILAGIFRRDCHHAFLEMLQAQRQREEEAKVADSKNKKAAIQADDMIEFRQLKPKGASDLGSTEDEFEVSLQRAKGASDGASAEGESSASAVDMTKLSRVFQLTGFSDPIYAEAYVNINQYDIVLDVLVVNQTNDTLQNLTIELTTMSDLKLGEKPSTHTIRPHDFCTIRASIKVSSTDTGTIFGNVVYDIAGSAAADRNCVVLNDIHVDIMDYIVPTSCSDEEFRSMWATFDWENSLPVLTGLTSLTDYLHYFEKITNMKTLTTDAALMSDSGILVANLAAKSLFGEDALANLSIELTGEGRIVGRVRIRSRTQGIAVALGKKFTLSQSSVPLPPSKPAAPAEVAAENDGETAE